MIKPTMSSIPGMGAVTDTLDFVKNLWGGMSVPGMGIPGMVMPTLSVEEINKQISDLKAVESWLTLNMNMLRGTIQALEVQSATISTLKSMGETLSAAVKPGAASAKPMHEKASPIFGTPTPPPKAAAEPAAAPEPAPEPKAEAQDGKSKTDVKDPASFMSPQANPAMWWNMLQDQFKQAVTSAMATEPATAADKSPANGKAKAPAKAKSATPAKRKPPAKTPPRS